MIPPPEPRHTIDCPTDCATDHAEEHREAWQDHLEQQADDTRELREAFDEYV